MSKRSSLQDRADAFTGMCATYTTMFLTMRIMNPASMPSEVYESLDVLDDEALLNTVLRFNKYMIETLRQYGRGHLEGLDLSRSVGHAEELPTYDADVRLPQYFTITLDRQDVVNVLHIMDPHASPDEVSCEACRVSLATLLSGVPYRPYRIRTQRDVLRKILFQ